MNNSRIMFLRDSQYHPCGCVAITIDRRNHRISYQYSVLNPNDKFDRKIARQLAIGRLIEVPMHIAFSRDTEFSMHLVSKFVMQHIACSKSSPARAVRAAKIWLKDTVV